MGLDMYLSASRYLAGWEHANAAEQAIFNAVREAAGLEAGDITSESPSGDISFNVCYWRKANHIHAWFVKNCQNGKDECQRSSVSRKQLGELAGLCETVCKDHSKAAELLPTQRGFFFGGTEYDEYYFKDCEWTAKALRGILSNPRLEGWTFIYQASW
jgi:hypothetical protein